MIPLAYFHVTNLNLTYCRNKTPDSAGHGSVSSRGGDTTQAADPSCFAAVFEGTGSAAGEVGVAAISLASPGLILCQVILRTVSLMNTE